MLRVNFPYYVAKSGYAQVKRKGFEMKKLGAFIAICLLIFGGLFLWLVSQTGPENANSETITVDIEDKFER